MTPQCFCRYGCCCSYPLPSMKRYDIFSRDFSRPCSRRKFGVAYFVAVALPLRARFFFFFSCQVAAFCKGVIHVDLGSLVNSSVAYNPRFRPCVRNDFWLCWRRWAAAVDLTPRTHEPVLLRVEGWDSQRKCSVLELPALCSERKTVVTSSEILEY